MIELLSCGNSKPRVEYPDSGPGPITLSKGDETLGLFGIVSYSDFFTGTELIKATGSPAKTSPTDTTDWVKMMVDKQVLFIPRRPLSSGGNWNEFYERGLVYGDGTDGKYPSVTPVKQQSLVVKAGSIFRVRLFGKGDPDPITVPAGASNTQLLKDFELGRFLAATHYMPGNNHEQLSNSWRLYPMDSGVTWISRAIWMMETYGSNVSQALSYYLRSFPAPEPMYLNKSISSTNSYLWWPVLEVMPVDTLFAIDTPSNLVIDETVPAPIAVTSTDYEEATEADMLKPISLQGVRYDTTDPKAVAITSLDYEA